jgi:hypothetical protein
MSINTIDQFKSLVTQRNGIARPNLFRVKLPTLPGATSEELNILCKDVTIPGRQILTSNRQIGMKLEKIPYGYSVPEVSMTFHVLNDYGVKEYFETWQSLAVNQDTYEIGYQKTFAQDVVIEQLRKVEKVPQFLRRESFSRGGISQFLPRTSDIGIFDTFFDIGAGLSDIVIYKCRLIDAFPTGITDIQLNNELDGIVELNIQMSYTDVKPLSFISPTNIDQVVRNGVRTFLGSIF